MREVLCFFFSSRRRHTRCSRDWSSDVCSSDLFDAAGNLLQAWGGSSRGYDWPGVEDGIFVDTQGHVWIGGNGARDHQVLKFTRDGKLLLQIGQAGVTGGDSDTAHLGRPASVAVDPATNELFVADGYTNHRVIVFDAQTGAYKRHW